MQVQFESMADFFNMGGYAFFVWVSFAVSLVAMATLTAHTVVVTHKIKASVALEQARAMRILQARAQRKQKRAQKAELQTEQEPDNQHESLASNTASASSPGLKSSNLSISAEKNHHES